ncbi:MAG: hypothetical protein KJ955_02410 [Nanoarchaeota archaeon]|nr:hypothetical protein [Nanoarchaeota archaeon]
MAHDCKCSGKCTKRLALETAVGQYHKWDDMVFKAKDGVPPLVNVQMTAYTMDFFLRETQLLKLLFAPDPSHSESTNTNMATVLYDRDKLVGIAIEYGNNEKAYIAMDELDADDFRGLADWQQNPGLHAAEMRTRIKAYTGREIGLIKCADLKGFFGNLGKVVENDNTLEMLLEGVKFACSAVSAGHLSIQPEPKFFGYLKMLNDLTKRMDVKMISGAAMALGSVYDSCLDLAEKVNISLPEGVTMGLVLQNKRGNFASVEVFTAVGYLYFHDYGDLIPVRHPGVPLKEAIRDVNEEFKQNLTIGLSTDFLYNATHAAMTASPYKLGKAVFNAVRNGEIVVC